MVEAADASQPSATATSSGAPSPHPEQRNAKSNHRTASQVSGSRHQTESISLDLVAVVLGLTVTSMLFQTLAPHPYMDEPFHVPQTQQYCRGRFLEWDPKITTFPGLYLIGAAVGWTYHHAVNLAAPGSKLAQAPLCDTPVLRSVNIAFAAACFLLVHALYRKLHPQLSGEHATQMALSIILLPTNFFYIFLYYTDVGSLASVLASLLAAVHRRYALSAAAAALAVLFRQTNAVWAAFILLASILQRFFQHNHRQVQQSGLAKQVVSTVKLSWLDKWWLLSEMGPLAAVPAAFAAFVVWNGGIVVGDRSNHAPKLHLVQPLYFLLFAAAALAQIHFHPARLADAFGRLTLAFRRRPADVLKPLGMAFVLAAYVVHNFTLVHPFLLADNRHYIFYVWKDLVAPYPTARYCLIPLYLYAGWSLLDSLRAGGQLDIWIAALATCTAATLAPAWLLELRYFSVPFVLVALHMQPPSQRQLLQTIALFAAVNVFTIYMFLFRPFQWGDGTVARFMW